MVHIVLHGSKYKTAEQMQEAQARGNIANILPA